MPSTEHELIKQIKVAEQQADQIVKEAETESSIVMEKAQSERIRRLEQAKTEAREILKKKVEEAKDTSCYKDLIENAEKSSEKLSKDVRSKMPEVAEKISDFILKIGREK
ncbi:MAG: hypothetical protein KGD64_09500 [Candidatus Heimdallarchaeota archaeon]|nr:hypothetical protein [Candidatus Heimdallarchaeota archaeon]